MQAKVLKEFEYGVQQPDGSALVYTAAINTLLPVVKVNCDGCNVTVPEGYTIRLDFEEYELILD